MGAAAAQGARAVDLATWKTACGGVAMVLGSHLDVEQGRLIIRMKEPPPQQRDRPRAIVMPIGFAKDLLESLQPLAVDGPGQPKGGALMKTAFQLNEMD